MRLLVCTQTVDKADANLGFFHSWLEEFAKHADEVHIICLFEGRHDLPSNVHVYSLGKEHGRVSSARYALRFWTLLKRLHRRYESVFVHMNPEYVVLGGLWWRLSRRIVILWYTHKNVDLKLRLAALLANRILSASSESFRLPSKKLSILGHGIRTDLFQLRTPQPNMVRIITLGRISPTKRLIEMLAITDVLNKDNTNFTLTFVGGTATDADVVYAEQLQTACRQRTYRDRIRLTGSVAYSEVPALLRDSDVLLNLSDTGSLDKAALEALAAGVAVVTTNEGLASSLPAGLSVRSSDPRELATAIMEAKDLSSEPLRAFVKRHHGLPELVQAIMNFYGTATR